MTAAVLALDYWLDKLSACTELHPLATHVRFTGGPATYTGAAAWARMRHLPSEVVQLSEVISLTAFNKRPWKP